MRNFLMLLFTGLCLVSMIWFIIGMISPQKAIKWGNKETKSRKKIAKYSISTLIISFVLVLVAAPPLTPEQKLIMEQKRQEDQLKEASEKEAKTKTSESSTPNMDAKQQESEEKGLRENQEQQNKHEEWASVKHPFMQFLTDHKHPRIYDRLEDVEKYYKKNNLEEYVVISKGTSNNKKNDDWLFWYSSRYDRKAKIDRIEEMTCAFSRINGGMTLEEALPIILTYLPTGEVNNHRRTAYRASKSGNELPFYLFQFSGQLYLSVKIDDGCVSSFTIGGEPYTGKGYNDSHGYESMEYDLKPFVKE